MEEYIKKLLEQVRFKKAHRGIAEEIRAHIEDQIEDNMAAGMDREAAEKAAIEDMGDPVEVGISMDRVHRPQIAWQMVLGAVVVGIIGSIIHILLAKSAAVGGNTGVVNGSSSFILYTVLGIIAMVLVYLMDYTAIARFSRILAVALFILIPITDRMGRQINGTHVFLSVGPITILTTAVMLLYIPLYGGIIYKYKGGKCGSLIKALLWIVIPCGFVFLIESKSTAFIMAVSMLAQLTIAILKGWIKVPKVPVIAGIWSVFILSPVILVWGLYSLGTLAEYQMMRLEHMFKADSPAYYEINTVREFARSSGLLGGGSEDIFDRLPSPNSDYVLTYITSTWGTIAVIAVIAAVGGLIIAGFITSSKSKNQLGQVMGSGCMMALLASALLNMGAAFGVIPFFSSFFPFISAGGSNLIVSYAFLGIIMCIYKYKTAYPQHMDIDIRGKIKLGKIEFIKN
ncbi:cell division protein FtsW, lipid II flippase [Butyrivibrio sp. ob235]|uniref:FtsW/RodA/SpoVE family cell cycle protein n=1 Tax=Butyrivibrio sp. ob235 TaxID=1761780 RepID=UPI0008AC9890|nr:FtsW/RodA/SpoVE family cell cycle protein [Butyrivibrio sp. ob235]SEL12748.1 cell division protein FtsW, lipid II flippase [Butyrivibrio sp. ob235]